MIQRVNERLADDSGILDLGAGCTPTPSPQLRPPLSIRGLDQPAAEVMKASPTGSGG